MSEKRPLNLLFGFPDDGIGKVRAVDAGKSFNVMFQGTVSIRQYLSLDRFALKVLYIQRGQSGSLQLGPGPLLNHVADPDQCSYALKLIERIVEKSNRPCFNHPRAISATTRDGVARALRDTPGLIVPKVARMAAGPGRNTRSAVEAGGLSYPILMRVCGQHGGTTVIKVDSPDDLEAAAELKIAGTDLYATEFFDFVSPDGRYRKYRIAVVGDEIFLRHLVIGDSWLLHAARRGIDTEREELAALREFDANRADRLRPLFQEIGRRLGLDYFGVDCSIDASGRVVLFEANACMNILDNTQRSPNMWDAPIARILSAVENRLAVPRTWRDFRPSMLGNEAAE